MRPKRPHYKWELLFLLWIAYFLNQGDRQIYNAVIPSIGADLQLGPVELGSVVTVFTLLYGFFVPIAGCLGDAISKKWIVCISLLTFSAGTLLTGFSNGLLLLILFRSVATGIGEAFYYPAANSLIGHYHRDTRAQAMAVHQSSLYAGTIVSSWMAASIDAHHDWRAAFYAFGAFGLLMAIVIAARLRDEHRDPDAPAGAPAARESAPPLSEILGAVLRTPTLYLLSAAFGAMVFVGVGSQTWMPTYLQENFGLSKPAAGLNAVLYHFVGAFLGVMIGGRVSDRLAARRPTIRLETGSVGLLLGAPFIYLMGTSSNLPVVYAALAGFGFFRGIYDSNLFAALFDVVHPRHRSSATGIMLCFGFTASAAAPMLLGWVKQHAGLGPGLAALAPVYLLGAALILVATARFFPRDSLRATRDPRPSPAP